MHEGGEEPVERNHEISFFHALKQLPFYAATSLLLPQLCGDVHPNHLQCYFLLLTVHIDANEVLRKL